MTFVQQYGSGGHRYRAKPFVRHHSGGDGTILWPQQQQGPHPFCIFGWEQGGACRNGPPVNDGLANSIAQGHHSGGDGTALWPLQQQGPRLFCSFGWEQRGACRNEPPVDVNWRIVLRRGKRSGMLAWTAKRGDNGLRRR